MTKAFDLAEFVPATLPQVGDTVQVTIADPLQTDWGVGGIGEAPKDGVTYGRQNATWMSIPSGYLPLTGGTMTGAIALAGNSNTRFIAGYATGTFNQYRWVINYGNAETETGNNAGSNFSIMNFADNGASLGTPFSINRATGIITIQGLASNAPCLVIPKPNGGTSNIGGANLNGSPRWQMYLADYGAELGSNLGSNFRISSFSDSGVLLTSPLVINRASGQTIFSTMPSIPGGTANYALVTNGAGVLTWAPQTSVLEAPVDGRLYGRENGIWVEVPTSGGGGIAEAPQNGMTYARNNAAWVNLTHNDITDWNVTLGPYALIASVPVGSNTIPVMDGTGAAGSGAAFARGDHVHPTDTSRYATSNPAGYQTAADVAAALGSYALASAIPIASTTNPLMNGAVAVGVGTTWARADHVHPSDTSKLNLSGGTMTGALILNADPTVNLGAATMQYVTNSVSNAVIDCGTY